MYLSARLSERCNSKEVRRNEEWEHGSIVAGTENRGDKTYWLDGIAVTTVAYRVVLLGGGALEVVRAKSVLALLLAEGLKYLGDSLLPERTEDRIIACYLPVVIS